MKTMKIILVFIGTVLLGSTMYYLISRPYYHMSYMMHYNTSILYIGIISVVGFMLIVVMLLTRTSGNHSNLNQLNYRLANGDISIEEYQRIKQAISGE